MVRTGTASCLNESLRIALPSHDFASNIPGTFDGEVNLQVGETVVFSCGVGSFEGHELGKHGHLKFCFGSFSRAFAAGKPGNRRLPVEYGGLSAELSNGDPVLLNDGTVRLEVVHSPREYSGDVTCTVIEAGVASSRKGVNVPGTLVELPSIGPKDEEALRHALPLGIDFVAVSYVRTVNDLIPAKTMIEELAPGVPIVAKIEHPSALGNLEDIMDMCMTQSMIVSL